MNIKNRVFSLLPKGIKKGMQEKKQREIFEAGYKRFVETGHTPEDSYLALINLFCSTNGKFSDEFNNKVKMSPTYQETGLKMEGICAGEDLNAVNETLNSEGYAQFAARLDKDSCKRLYDFALKTPAKIPAQKERVVYDPGAPVSEIYRFDLNDVMSNPDVQRLVMDPSLIAIARNYLESEPIFDFPAMWWSTAFSKQASAEAAQLYHFDMDRIKWLKIFFYITDVTNDNGPHCYIAKSHKAGNKPQAILDRGYARIPDSDLLPFYPEEDFKTLRAPSGTIFAGDTKCWHKGQSLKEGHRLVLEFEYASSLFGANYGKLQIKRNSASPEFLQFLKDHPFYSQNIEIIN